jgi:hypothetical protein
MNVYPLPPKVRRRFCVIPGITGDEVKSLRGVSLLTRAVIAAELKASNIEDLADLALCLPEEILSLPGVKLATLLNLQDEILERIDAGPLVKNLSEHEETVLARLKLRDAHLPVGISAKLPAMEITRVVSLARTSPVSLLARGLTLKQVRATRGAITAHLTRPSEAEVARAYAKRPLPPGFAETPIKDSRLMLCWLGDLMLKEGSKTIGQAMKSLPKSAADRDFWHEHEYRPHELHIALAAKRLIATIPGGERLYRVPYQAAVPVKRPPLFGDLSSEEQTFLDQTLCDPRSGLSAEQELAYENGPRHSDAFPAPDWIYAASNYALDPLGFIAEADLPTLFEAAGGRKETVCDMLIAVRRALLDREEPGAGETVYGPAHPYIRFFRTFPKAA